MPGTTVNRFCASSLQSIRMAYHAIKAGEGDAFVAAGVESISQVNGYPKSDEELHPALFGDDAPIANVYIPMGLTAENVAERWNVPREEMDRFAQRSQERAVAAQDSGFFAREIAPYEGVATRRRPAALVDAREARRARAGVQAGRQGDGRQLVPAERRRRGGRRHVGRPRARSSGIKPRARIIASAVSGVEPEIMGVGPIEAVRTRARLRRDDDRRRRRDGAERGLRRAGAARLLRGRRRSVRRQAESARRCDRARPSVRDDGRPDHVHAAQRPRDARPARSGSRRCASAAGRAWRCSSSVCSPPAWARLRSPWPSARRSSGASRTSRAARSRGGCRRCRSP